MVGARSESWSSDPTLSLAQTSLGFYFGSGLFLNLSNLLCDMLVAISLVLHCLFYNA